MTFIVEAFFSGCISKAINDCKDYSWGKIKSVINDKNDRNLSTRIYRVIEKALIKVTDKKFKSTDILYEAIEKIFIEFKEYGSTIESVTCGLEMFNSDVTVEKCENFLEKFYEGICQDGDLHNIIGLILQEKGIDINQKEFQQLNKTVEYGFDQLNRKIDNLVDSTIENSSNNDENETENKTKFQNNKKQDYVKNWNSRLFLHVDNDDKPITLADAFIMPDYKVHNFIQKIGDWHFDTFDQIIKEFVKYEKTSTMLITGVPGIGKSSITSWVANQYKDDDRFIILRFRDWDIDELENGLLKAICNKLECKNKDLNNKILIIDGFDEMKVLDIRHILLNALFNDIKDRENFKCIITSRPAYIDSSHFQNVIEIKEFNIEKVDSFYKKIKGSSLINRKKIESNLDVLGIPVILYMAIMSGVDINENHTKPELYNKIFAIEGGIFDKFYDGENEYSEGSQIMRNPENIKMYLKFLREIAYIMFSNNKQNLRIGACKIPELVFQNDTVSILEFPIKHLFENTKTDIEFIHKSIYEYFVSEYVYMQIIRIVEECESKEVLAGEIASLLKSNHLSEEICEFLKYKISQNSNNNLFNDVLYTFNLMICDGMTFHMVNRCKNVIWFEMNVFANMLEIIHLWNNKNFKFDNKIFDYMKYNYEYALNLAGVDFTGINLTKLILTNVDLSYARLDSANLEGMDLRNTKFIGASIHEINLDGANLDGAIFSENHIAYLRKKYNLRGIKVYYSTNNVVLNYK